MPKGKKADILIMNPPYDNSLHEKFLIKAFDIANIIVSIQPNTWLLGQHQKTKITNLINQYYTNIENIDGNMYFDAMLNKDIAIIYTNKKLDKKLIFNKKEYNKCEDITKISSDELLMQFLKIINNIIKNDKLLDHLKATPDNFIYSLSKIKEFNPDPNWWTLEFPAIRGNISKSSKDGKADDYYTLFSNNDKFNLSKINQVKNWPKTNKSIGNNKIDILDIVYLAFNSKIDAFNCLNYLKTDFVRMCLYIAKDSQTLFSGALKLIPWFDFSDSHFSKSPREIDDWLFKKYNISDEIRKHIEEILPDYYNIRK